MVIRLSDVRDVIRRAFGEEAAGSGMPAAAANLLRSWVPRQDPLGDLQKKLEETLFNGLYDLLGPGMLLQDGRAWRRVHTDELAPVADELIGLLFDSMGLYASSYELVRDWAMYGASLSAQTALYRRFASFQSPEEHALTGRILRGRLEGQPLPDWLAEPSPNGKETDP